MADSAAGADLLAKPASASSIPPRAAALAGRRSTCQKTECGSSSSAARCATCCSSRVALDIDLAIEGDAIAGRAACWPQSIGGES